MVEKWFITAKRERVMRIENSVTNKNKILEDELNILLSSKHSLNKKRIKDFFSYLLLSIVGITMLLPFLWMVSTSLKDPSEVFSYPPRWLPSEITYYLGNKEEQIAIRKLAILKDEKIKIKIINSGEVRVVAAEEVKSEWKLNIVWENYPKAWKLIRFGRGYLNTIFIATMVTFGQVVTSSMAAYAFARLNFPLRDKLFFAYLATMMIPRDVTMIPVFILLKKLPEFLNYIFHTQFWKADLFLFGSYVGKPVGIDSYFALIMPGFFSAYGTIMLRQFFMSIPVDLEDAAKIDGCSFFGVYRKIILPLSKPALATLTTFTFMGSWRDFLWPLIIANSQELMPLQILLQSFQGFYGTEWTLLMAGSIIVLFPIIIVFIFNQRFFIEGIQLGAIKG